MCVSVLEKEEKIAREVLKPPREWRYPDLGPAGEERALGCPRLHHEGLGERGGATAIVRDGGGE